MSKFKPGNVIGGVALVAVGVHAESMVAAEHRRAPRRLCV